jgi:phage-related protein
MTIGELVANIRADNSDFDRGLATSQLRMQGFTVDASGRLRNLQGHFVRSGEVMERALSDVTDEVSDLATQTTETTAVVEVETRTMAMRFRALARAADQMGESLGNRLGRVVDGLRNVNLHTDRLGAIGGRLGGVAMTFAKIGAAVGTAVPLVAGLATTVAQIAPAAGVAVTGLIAVQLATKALKIGMVGVKDAVSAAMDPSDPEAYAEALKKLSPSARAFVGEIRTLQPQFKALQQEVQQNLFKGLDTVLRDMGTTTLPILRQGLTGAATSLNYMAHGVGDAAIEMSKNGVLGQAIRGANEGLANLSAAPGQLVRALTQIGAAAAPSFARLTAAAGDGLSSLSARMDKAFADGSIQSAIEQAIGLIGQLGSVLGNLASIAGSVFGAASASGGGFLGTLQEITGALKTAFASPAVQAALGAMFDTMAMLARTIGPLLTQALGALAPVFTALGPPIQRIIALLGPALSGIIGALGPVLAAAATAVGALLDAVSPLLPVIGELVAGLLPALTPLLTLVAGIFTALAPLVSQFAQILMSALTPVLAALVPAIQPIIDALMVLVQAIFPILSAQAAAFAPLIATLAQTFATLLVALAPVIAQLIVLIANVLTKMMPVLIPIIELVARLAAVFANELARVISGVVVPAFQMIAALLRGDFSGAWSAAKTMVMGIIDAWIRMFRDLPARASEALSGLASALWSRIQEAGGRMVDGLRQKRDEAINKLKELPGIARNALGDLGSLLWNAGSRLIGGLIDGISSKISSLRSKLGSITNMIPDWKGPPETDAKLLTPAGVSLIEGFQRGITAATPGLRNQLGGLTGALPGMLPGPSGGMVAGAGGGRWIIELAGDDSMKSIIRRIVQVDGRGSVATAFE